MNNRLKAYIALLATTFLWGIAPPIIKYSLIFLTPLQFLSVRFFIVSLCVLPFFIIKFKKHPFKTKDLPYLLLNALCGTTLTLGLIFWGLSKTTSIDSAIIVATCPLMIVFAGAVFLKETVTKQEKAGLVLAFIGTLIAVVSPLINGNGGFSSERLIGNFLVFISNISWTVYSILSKKYSKKYPSFNITAFSFFVGFISLAPFILLGGNRFDSIKLLISNPGFPGILYMSFFGSIIAFFAYTYGLSLIEASEATLFTYLEPLFTMPLAVLWLGEKMTIPFLIGSIFIVCGVVLTETRKKFVI